MGQSWSIKTAIPFEPHWFLAIGTPQNFRKASMAHNEELRMSATSEARTVRIASAIWAGSIFLSRIMGLVREQIIGRTLGASRETDLYLASFTLPDVLKGGHARFYYRKSLTVTMER
jgi:hypothetical protein